MDSKMTLSCSRIVPSKKSIGVVHSISREITKLLDREQQQQNGDDHVRISSPLTEDG